MKSSTPTPSRSAIGSKQRKLVQDYLPEQEPDVVEPDVVEPDVVEPDIEEMKNIFD